MKKISWLLLTAAFIILLGAPPALAARRPLLVVDHYETQPNLVRPGRHFTLKLRLKNEGERRAEQVTLTLSSNAAAPSAGQQTNKTAQSPTTDFTTLETSNIKYLGVIKSKEEKTVTFKLAAANIAGSKVAALTFNLDYADGNRNYASRQSMGITILRRPDIIIDQLKYPAKVSTGRKFKFSAEVINAGNFVVNGVRVRFSGRGIKVKKDFQFIGPLEAGDGDVFTTSAEIGKSGTLKGKIIISYRDDFNQLQTISKQIQIFAKPAKQSAKKKAASHKSTGFIGFLKALLGLGTGK